MKRGPIHIVALLVPFLLSLSCAYIVLPEGLEDSSSADSRGWQAIPTNVSTTEGGALHVDLALLNETGNWSAMSADDSPAVLHAGGEDHECGTVYVGTGGHRVAPGFQLRGFIGGTKSQPELQLLYVECEGATADPGSTITIEYSYVTGQYNYYEQDKGRVETSLEVDLDQVATDLSFPVGTPLDGLVQDAATPMEAINKVSLELTEVERTEDGLRFSWKTANPGEYPSYIHIGNPPVIGKDGILYGFYETPDIVSVPITPAGDAATWTTEVAVPADVQGLYILLSVETGKARLFANYAIDITDR